MLKIKLELGSVQTDESKLYKIVKYMAENGMKMAHREMSAALGHKTKRSDEQNLPVTLGDPFECKIFIDGVQYLFCEDSFVDTVLYRKNDSPKREYVMYELIKKPGNYFDMESII